MRTVRPDYYDDFSCIADRCHHCCCIGWEIDIDDDTYKKYMKLTGEDGTLIRNALTGEDVKHFALDKDGKCPLLNDKGLCTLCLKYGEKSLCSVCHMYPRFAFRYGSTEEMSLSISCEEAARLIIGRSTQVTLLHDAAPSYDKSGAAVPYDDPDNRCDFDGGDDEFCPDEISRIRDDAMLILQERSLPINKRICSYLHFCEDVQSLINREEEEPGLMRASLPELENKYVHAAPESMSADNDIFADMTPMSSSEKYDAYSHRLTTFSELEILGTEWTQKLTMLRTGIGQSTSTYCNGMTAFDTYIQNYSEPFEQLLVYFTTRYFMRSVFDCDITSKAKLAVTSFLMIRDICAADYDRQHDTMNFISEICDICRIYSGEVEHSEDNTQTMTEEFVFDRFYDLDSLCRQVCIS